MEQELRALLKADPAIVAIVAGRVNFGVHPQGQPLPAIVLNVVSDVAGVTLDGPENVATARIQVDCYADTYGAATLLGRAVLACLNGYAGGNLQGVFHAGSRGTQDGGSGEVTRPFRTSLDFEIMFNKG